MNTLKTFAIYGVALFLVQLMIVAPAMSIPRSYTRTGKISAIDEKDNTVVVNVPYNGNQTFTVAGPLSPNAHLEIGGKKASLDNFHDGEQVTVKYMRTKTGPEIMQLMAKS